MTLDEIKSALLMARYSFIILDSGDGLFLPGSGVTIRGPENGWVRLFVRDKEIVTVKTVDDVLEVLV